MRNTTKQTDRPRYEAPNIKVVGFKVEQGFGGTSTNSSPSEGTITFEGLIDHSNANDHSGLDQYINRGSIFGDD